MITKALAGGRLDKTIGLMLPGLGRGLLYKLLRKKSILLNGQRAKGGEQLKAGDVLRLYLSDETFLTFSGQQEDKAPEEPPRGFPEPPVCFENEHVLILDKPAGVLAQKGSKEDYSLSEYLKYRLYAEGEAYPNAAPAHRLDRNTSGLTACAKTPAGSRELSRLFRERLVKKEYLALVWGAAEALFSDPAKPLTLSGYLSKEEEKNLSHFAKTPFPGSVPVGIRVSLPGKDKEKSGLLFQGKRISLLSIELLTGKSHQIRAELSALGFPLLGDPKYGNERLNANLFPLGIRRQLLHACRLSFPEEAGAGLSGKVVEAPVPEDFREVLG